MARRVTRRYSISLYANITNIRWDFESDKVAGCECLARAHACVAVTMEHPLVQYLTPLTCDMLTQTRLLGDGYDVCMRCCPYFCRYRTIEQRRQGV